MCGFDGLNSWCGKRRLNVSMSISPRYARCKLHSPGSNMTNPDEDVATSAAGGTAGLEGYLYQATASTWVALELVLNQRLAVELVLEPVTHEDIEAAVANPEAAELDSQLLVSFPLQIQIKQRSTMNWTVAGLNELLTKPRKRRKSPVENLENPNLRYLLITNASVDGVARGLVTRQLGVFPAANDMPVSLAGALPDAAGRVGVMPLIDDERLTERIERLLIRRFKVPVARVGACRLALDSQALERMRRPGGGVWSRAELDQLVADHDGLPSSATLADRFVPPTNFDDFVHIVDTQHAIILTGPSGTGKTSTAEALLRHLHAGADGFEFTIVEGGPEKIRARRPNGPIVFMIEDPWGRVRADPRAEPWNEAIIGLLAKASPQRKFIITSRSDVLADAQPPSLPRSMMALLEGYHYPTAQKRSLFDNRLVALPRDLQSDVDKTRADIVRDVSTPAEIERYFWLLTNDRRPNEELWGFIRRCIATAKSSSVDTALLSNVRQRNDHRWAILTWGLFKASRKLSYATIGQIQEELDAIDPVYFDGVTDYLGFLVAGRHLHQTGAVLSYTHPLVEKGLQSVVDEKSSLAKRVLADLFAALLALKDENWGLESAASLLAAMIRTGLGTRHVTPAVQSDLDVWLVQRLTTLGPDFEDDLDLAATVGSRANAPPEIRLARWLTNKGGDWAAPWEEPEDLDATDYAAMAAAPAAAAICGAFVRRILGQGGAHYPLSFVDGLARISPGIATDFVATARALVTDGVNSGLDVVLEGARRDLTGLAAVADQAIAYVDSRDGAGAAFLLAEANGEYDGETANTISEDYARKPTRPKRLLASTSPKCVGKWVGSPCAITRAWTSFCMTGSA